MSAFPALAPTTTCTDCGLCRRECALLARYGSPATIATRLAEHPDETEAIAFSCTLCGLCTAICPEDFDTPAFFRALRKEHATHHAPSPCHKGLLFHERLGSSRLFRHVRIPEGATTLFFPGCNLPGSRPEIIEDAFSFLANRIPGLGIVLDCCGTPSRALGRLEGRPDGVKRLQALCDAHGIREVVTACPNCHALLSEFLTRVAVVTLYEKLDRSDFPVPELGSGHSLCVHDACVTRHDAGIQTGVRNLLSKSRASLSEMPHHGATTFCCGEGAGVSDLNPKLSANWTHRRKSEARGRQIVTYCGSCSKRLDAPHILDLLFPEKRPPASGLASWKNRLLFKIRQLGRRA